MAVKTYDATALSQRMVDLYADTVRYHASHWQTLNGKHPRQYVGGSNWVNVPDDTTFITNIYHELQRSLVRLEENSTMITNILGVTLSAFTTAAQTALAG